MSLPIVNHAFIFPFAFIQDYLPMSIRFPIDFTFIVEFFIRVRQIIYAFAFGFPVGPTSEIVTIEEFMFIWLLIEFSLEEG